MDSDFDMQQRWFRELDDELNAGEDDASDPAIGQEAPGDVFGESVSHTNSKSFCLLLPHFVSDRPIAANSQGPWTEDADDQAIGQETPHGPVSIGLIFEDLDIAAAIAASALLRPFNVLDLNSKHVLYTS
jgi:hypothetical protein